jgi:integrase
MVKVDKLYNKNLKFFIMSTSKLQYESFYITKKLKIHRQRNKSKNWNIYFWNEDIKRPFNQSLKTDDIEKAKEIAIEIYGWYKQRAITGFVSEKVISVEKICKALNKHFDMQEKHGDSKTVAYITKENFRRRKYLNSFSDLFGNTYIKDINYQKLFLFYSQFDLKLSKTEYSYLNQTVKKIFEYALKKGAIENIPPFPSLKYKNKEERSSISRHDFEVLIKHLNSRKRRNGNDKETNYILMFALKVLERTGLRAGKELSEIKGKDLVLKNLPRGSTWILKINGGKVASKDNKKREIVITQETAVYLRYALFVANPSITEPLDNNGLKQTFSKYADKYIFRTSRNTFPDLSKLMKAAILEIEDKLENINVTPYSIRHSYINYHLLKKEINIATLASHCGTSIEMINDYYSHLTSQMSAEYFMKDESLIHNDQAFDQLASDMKKLLIE